MANGVEFGDKEHFMIVCNDIIKNNMSKRNTFLDAIAVNRRDVYIPVDTAKYIIVDKMIDSILDFDDEADDDD